MAWLISYVGSNYALIAVVVLVVAALGVFAFFAKNWKAVVTALVLLALGLAGQQIDKNAYQRRVNEDKAAEVQRLKDRIETLNNLSDYYAERLKADTDKLDELERRASETPQNDKPGLDRAGAGRVRDIR